MMGIVEVGEPVLRQHAAAVKDFHCRELAAFIDQLMHCMNSAGGIGIAAPQVGVSQAIMIIAPKPNARYPNAPQMPPLILINPQIKAQYGELSYSWEGCLSVPGIRGWVCRENEVELTFQNLQGEQQFIHLSGFIARIFLHEYDHLIGLTFLDRVSDNRQLIANSVYQKILAGQIPWP